MSQGSGFRIDLAFMFANIAFMQNIEAFRVGGHDAVFDTVVHHLDEMARSVRTAMQIAVFRTGLPSPARCTRRSEEHTSELQSLMRISYAVFFLKKKITKSKL